LYVLETLKLLQEREWLVPRLGADGVLRLEPALDMATALAQEPSGRELLPPSVRALIQARLAKLQPSTHQLVMASARTSMLSNRRDIFHRYCQLSSMMSLLFLHAVERVRFSLK
jgi:hypothetical protein